MDSQQDTAEVADEVQQAIASSGSPMRLPPSRWWSAFKRTFTEFMDDNLTDWAGSLTYYGILAIFPALIVLISIVGLTGQASTQELNDNLGAVAPGPAKTIITNAIGEISHSGAAGLGLIIGIAGALWAASGYVGAFSRASNVIYEVEEGRPFWKLLPRQIVITTVMVVLLSLCVVAVIVSGPLASEAGQLVGASSTAVLVWEVAKWPVIAVVVVTMLAILFYTAPNVKQVGFRWITPGGLLGAALWVLASLGFAFYVDNFAAYNKTYGSIAGVIVFLLWLWITNIAFLLGAEFNAELERQRELSLGLPAEQSIQLEPRQSADQIS